MQKVSIGFQQAHRTRLVAVERLRPHARQRRAALPGTSTRASSSVCNPAYPGSTPAIRAAARGRELAATSTGPSWRPGCRRTASSRSTCSRRPTSRSFDSWTTTLRGRLGRQPGLAQLRAGQLAVVGRPADRVVQRQRHRDRAGEPVQRGRVGPDAARRAPPRRGERGAASCPCDFQVAPIFQLASSRPYSLNTGFDLDGDGLATDRPAVRGRRIPAAVFAVRGNATAIRALNPLGCQQVGVNSQRGGFVVQPRWHRRRGEQPLPQRRPAGHQDVHRRSRASDQACTSDLYNLFDTENLYFGSNGRLG